MNTQPDGIRHAMDQTEHGKWNSYNYPGTRQMCSICDQPTGRCEEDAIYHGDQPICEDCYDKITGGDDERV